VAPLEETVKSDRREFPQEMRSTLDRLWRRGTLPQRAGQIPQPKRGFPVSARHLLARQAACDGAELGAITPMIGGTPVTSSRRTVVRLLEDLMTRMGTTPNVPR
jgi:hypothetical protein